MTYHHLNRFKAHASPKLTPRERLLAWHLCLEIRANSSKFSTADRTLEEELGYDRRTIQKNLAFLVDLGLFTREKGNRRQAATYRLKVSCPLNCEDLESHNTKREIRFIEAKIAEALKHDTPEQSAKTPPQNSKNTADIETKREEEEGFISSYEKGLVLGLIKQTLKALKPIDLTEPHYTLKALTELNPNAITKRVFEIFADNKLDTWKRQAPYLKTTIERTPENLLTYAEQEALIQLGSEYSPVSLLETKSEVEPGTKSGYRIEHDYRRFRAFISETIKNQAERKLENPPLNELWDMASKRGSVAEALEGRYTWTICKDATQVLAVNGKLTTFYVETLFEFEQVLLNTCHLFGVKPNFSILTKGQDPSDLSKAELGFMPFDISIFTNTDFLLTAEELEQSNLREKEFEKAKQAFMVEQNLTQETFSLQKWFLSSTYKEINLKYPKPITNEEVIERWKSQISFLFALQRQAICDNQPQVLGENYFEWLQKNYTWQDDYEDFRDAYPLRPEGFKDTTETRTNFIRTRKFLDQNTLLMRVENYKKLLGDRYPDAAAKWLKNLETEVSLGNKAAF